MGRVFTWMGRFGILFVVFCSRLRTSLDVLKRGIDNRVLSVVF